MSVFLSCDARNRPEVKQSLLHLLEYVMAQVERANPQPSLI